MNKKGKECRSTMHHEEATKTEEDMEDEVEDKEEVKLCVIIAIILYILPEISRIPAQHVSIVMRPTMLLNIAHKFWLRCRKEEIRELGLMSIKYLLRKGMMIQEFK